ncbi:MAG: hypothetical protein ACLU3U_04815 [Gallintestinimicrobium sp.]
MQVFEMRQRGSGKGITEHAEEIAKNDCAGSSRKRTEAVLTAIVRRHVEQDMEQPT